MRLFTGIPLPGEIRENLVRLLGKLRPTARIRWSPIENVHITTKFIGEWPEDRLEELKAALRQLPRRDAIPIAIRDLGWFPNPHAPRVFWAAIQAPPLLADLAADTEHALTRLGVPVETRPFSPHLTLARIRPPAQLQELRRAIAALPSVEFGSFVATHFCLYLSQRSPSGSVYTELAGFAVGQS